MPPRFQKRWSIAKRLISAVVDRTTVSAHLVDSMSSHEKKGCSHVEPDLHLDVEMVEHWGETLTGTGVWSETTQDQDDVSRRILIKNPVIEGTLEQKGYRYRGRFKANGTGTGPLEILFRSCLSFLIEDSGGTMLHASGVMKEGRAWVFVGPTGAGKSTIAEEFAGGGVPFSLDRVVIEKCVDGGYMAHSTPFSDTSRILTGPVSAPLAGVYYLEQADHTALESMPPFEMLALLVSQSVSFSRDPKRVSATIGILSDLIEDNMVRKMRFREDSGFWRLLLSREEDANVGAGGCLLA